MTANAVLSGTYSDFKIVKTRSVFQMVIEGPIERAAEAVAMFGVPQPGQEIHVAVARLQVPHDAREAPGETTPSTRKVDTSENPPALARPNETAQTLSAGAALRGDKSAAKERYRMQDQMQQAVTRAALLCKEAAFQDWLRDRQRRGRNWAGLDRESVTANGLKIELGCIGSRSEIAGDDAVYQRFLALETQYKRDTGQMAEQRS